MPTIRISEIHSTNGIKPAIDYAEGLNEFGKVNSKDKAHATIRKDLEKHHINPDNLKNRAIMMDGNVNPLSASHDMVRTLHLFNDGGKNKAFRIIQSFDPQKLKYYHGQDIVKAHQAGIKLADQLSHHGKYLYLVCTHIDGGSPGGERPIHNHIIFLVTSLHGKQFRPRHLWTQVARTSDKIAKNMQLGVLSDQKITNPETRKPERHDINEEKMTQRTHHIYKKEYVRKQVDQAMMNKDVISIKDLANYLKPAGIYLKLYSKKTGNELKHLTFIDKGHPSKSGRPFKVRDRTLGSDYLKETIKHGLEQKATAAAHQRSAKQRSTMESNPRQELSHLAIQNRSQLNQLPKVFKPAATELTETNSPLKSKRGQQPANSSILANSISIINQTDQNFKNVSLEARIIRARQRIVKQLYQRSEQLRSRIQESIQIIRQRKQQAVIQQSLANSISASQSASATLSASISNSVKLSQSASLAQFHSLARSFSESRAFTSFNSANLSQQNYDLNYYNSKYQPTQNEIAWANLSVNEPVNQSQLNRNLDHLSSDNVRKSAIDVGKTFETYSFNNREGIKEFSIIADGLQFTDHDKNIFQSIYNYTARKLSDFKHRIKQTRAYNHFHNIFNSIKRYWHKHKLDVKQEWVYGDLPSEDSYEDFPNTPQLHKLIDDTRPIHHTMNIKKEPDIPSILHPIQRQQALKKLQKVKAYNQKAQYYNHQHHQENVYYQKIFDNSEQIEKNVNRNFKSAEDIFQPIKNKITSLINSAKDRIGFINKKRRSLISNANQKASDAIMNFTLSHTRIGRSAKAFASNDNQWIEYYQKRRPLINKNGADSVVNQFLLNNESYYYQSSVSVSQSTSESEASKSQSLSQSISQSTSESNYLSNLAWQQRMAQQRDEYDKEHHLGCYAPHHPDSGITPDM